MDGGVVSHHRSPLQQQGKAVGRRCSHTAGRGGGGGGTAGRGGGGARQGRSANQLISCVLQVGWNSEGLKVLGFSLTPKLIVLIQQDCQLSCLVLLTLC